VYVSGVAPQTQRRSYDGSGRRAQAQANRERILAAALGLFVMQGYAGTSIADISVAAGVSVPTVFAHFGSKVELFKQCVDSATVGDTEPVPLADRPEMVHVRAGRTARQVVGRLAALIAAAGPRVVPIYMVMYGAADADPEIRALARTMDEQRLAGATQLARIVMDRLGSDSEDLAAEIRDLIWTMNSPQTFSLLVTQRGWPLDRYEAWVRRTLLAATTGGR
jgi:AcrR family transcriptional regulator